MSEHASDSAPAADLSGPASVMSRRTGVERRYEVPSWFDIDLDPDSEAFRTQQIRLWTEFAGETGAAKTDPGQPSDEDGYTDAILGPVQSPRAAGEQLIALGHVIYHSGLSRGARALGWSTTRDDIGLALGRLGVEVQAVSLSRPFSDHEWCERLPSDERFDLIYFYGALRSCFDLFPLVRALRDRLTPGGRVLLVDEPVLPDGAPHLPYPWGVRLDSRSPDTRRRGRVGLGFQRSYLAYVCTRAGFDWLEHDYLPSRAVWVLSHRAPIIELGTRVLCEAEEVTWHALEPTGRWTQEHSVLYLDESADAVEIQMINHHQLPRFVTVTSRTSTTIEIAATRGCCIRVPQGGGRLTIECEPISPQAYGVADPRKLGIFVRTVSYC